MDPIKIHIETNGEGFYSITKPIEQALGKILNGTEGILFAFVMHTSCALTISEDYDPSARKDLENFMKHVAPRNLPFIAHTLEGPDDSPSHMKSILLQQHIALPVVGGKLTLGRWQGIYLTEFRDVQHRREIILKFMCG